VLLLAVAFAAAVCGCKKAPQTADRPAAKPAPPVPETLARVHWVGKARLAEDPKATNLLSIWAMPESTNLQEQILQKFAALPWRFSSVKTGESNTVANLFKPLLEDLVAAESWFELRQASNRPAEMALAVKLSDERASLWETNLGAGLESLAAGARQNTTNGWSLTREASPRVVQFERSGEWTVVAFSEQPGVLIPDLLSNMVAGNLSFRAQATNAWLQFEADLPRAAQALGLGTLPPYLPRVSLAFATQGEVVRTVGEFLLQSELNLRLDPWDVPTNFIHQPLIAFSALRGLGPWLSELPQWKKTDAGSPPNQAYLWSLKGLPFLTYFIAPLTDSSNTVWRFSDYMLREVRPLMSSNAMGTLELSTNPLALGWVNLPMISPYVSHIETNGVGYALSGVVPSIPLSEPFPPELLHELDRHTNLVWYDWELTGERLETALNVGQLLRFSLRKPQLPVDSTPMRWLKAVGPKLGNCGTVVTVAGPKELSLIRKSAFGLSALELHMICDWLLSPDFPSGLHTTRAPYTLFKRPNLPVKKTPPGEPEQPTTDTNEPPVK
jgi:hypothetical protein